MNIHCVKWGDKYSAEYVNRLYSMVDQFCPGPFEFYCHTDDTTGVVPWADTCALPGDLEGWWNKLHVLNKFQSGDNILFDLDIVIHNEFSRLYTTETRTLTVLYSKWKQGFLEPGFGQDFPTLYNSSVMKWSGDQGMDVYNYFQNHRDKILFKYKGIDKFLFNEDIDVDTFQTGIAYSYWKGATYKKDPYAEKKRDDYEICILNEGKKQEELDGWITDCWRV